MRLINDDCLKAMDTLIDEGVKVDVIITDPPYGVMKGKRDVDHKELKKHEWDTAIDFNELNKRFDDLFGFR